MGAITFWLKEGDLRACPTAGRASLGPIQINATRFRAPQDESVILIQMRVKIFCLPTCPIRQKSGTDRTKLRPPHLF
jgi:hypothetical protein